jgi:anti-sigma-K factor RskA
MSGDIREHAVEYLLGELSPDAAERFEGEMLSDARLAAEVERLRPVISKLNAVPGEGWAPPEPPALDVAAITGRVASEAPPGPPEPAGPEPAKRRRRFSDRFSFRLPQVAAAALSALLLLAAGTLIGMQLGGEDSPDRPTETLALSTIGNEVPQDATGEVKLTGVAEGGGEKAVLDVSGLKPNIAGEFYELWLIGDDGELVALGSFNVEPDGASQIEVPVPVNPGEFRYFDVSIEPDDGSPDHSGRSVLRGPTRT